ncbi:hypothetical protein BG004_007660, partial [Podila humilis]
LALTQRFLTWLLSQKRSVKAQSLTYGNGCNDNQQQPDIFELQIHPRQKLEHQLPDPQNIDNFTSPNFTPESRSVMNDEQGVPEDEESMLTEGDWVAGHDLHWPDGDYYMAKRTFIREGVAHLKRGRRYIFVEPVLGPASPYLYPKWMDPEDEDMNDGEEELGHDHQEDRAIDLNQRSHQEGSMPDNATVGQSRQDEQDEEQTQEQEQQQPIALHDHATDPHDNAMHSVDPCEGQHECHAPQDASALAASDEEDINNMFSKDRKTNLVNGDGQGEGHGSIRTHQPDNGLASEALDDKGVALIVGQDTPLPSAQELSSVSAPVPAQENRDVLPGVPAINGNASVNNIVIDYINNNSNIKSDDEISTNPSTPTLPSNEINNNNNNNSNPTSISATPLMPSTTIDSAAPPTPSPTPGEADSHPSEQHLQQQHPASTEFLEPYSPLLDPSTDGQDHFEYGLYELQYIPKIQYLLPREFLPSRQSFIVHLDEERPTLASPIPAHSKRSECRCQLMMRKVLMQRDLLQVWPAIPPVRTMAERQQEAEEEARMKEVKEKVQLQSMQWRKSLMTQAVACG